MFNVKLYTTSNMVIFFFQNNLKKPLFLILDFQQMMKSCDLKEIIRFKDFEVDNAVLGLERDIFEHC
jgi:hypothetical protein